MSNDYIVRDWDGHERRSIDAITLQLMAEMRKTMERHESREDALLDEIKTMVGDNKKESERRHAELSQRFEQMQQSTHALIFENNRTTSEIHKLFKEAFPDGDAVSHRQSHEKWIAKAEAEERFWLNIKEKAVTAIVIAVIGWAGLALWAAFLQGPAK